MTTAWYIYRRIVLIAVPPLHYWIGRYMILSLYRPLWLFRVICGAGIKLQGWLWRLHTYSVCFEGYKAACEELRAGRKEE